MPVKLYVLFHIDEKDWQILVEMTQWMAFYWNFQWKKMSASLISGIKNIKDWQILVKMAY